MLDKLNEMRIDQKLPPLLFNGNSQFKKISCIDATESRLISFECRLITNVMSVFQPDVKFIYTI